MRDIPVFTTENGAASLVFSQIPYTQKAYIRIQDTSLGEEFIKECVSFCMAAGAKSVYATGHSVCEIYPEHTAVIEMRADRCAVLASDASLFPVTEKTAERWREIYNKKVCNVPAGSWMTAQQAGNMQDCYFIHRNGELLGTGKASGDRIHWVASCKPGAGKDVVQALCHTLTGNSVTLEVASANTKAIRLYENLGFIRTKELLRWYQVK